MRQLSSDEEMQQSEEIDFEEDEEQMKKKCGFLIFSVHEIAEEDEEGRIKQEETG